MPLPPLLVFSIFTGLAAALAGRGELRTSPRPIGLTRAFLSFLLFATLVMVPASAYFYVFHGDWFLLYQIDVQRIPSAIALIGFMVQAGLGICGFLAGALLVRNQRESWAGALMGMLLLFGVAVGMLYGERIGQVGTFAEFHAQLGLEDFTDTHLMTGSLAMAAIVLSGLAFLLVRLSVRGGRR